MGMATTSASTSSQHLNRRLLPLLLLLLPSSSRRGWFSSLFGGAGAAIPAAVQAARSKTVSRLERKREREKKDCLEKAGKKTRCPVEPAARPLLLLSSFSFSLLSPRRSLF